MDIQVVKGQVRLSSVQMMVDTPEVKVVEVDANSKYYEVGAYADEIGDRQYHIFELFADENTLRIDETTDDRTEITFVFDEGESWQVMSDDGARYSFRIVFIKNVADRPNPALWLNE